MGVWGMGLAQSDEFCEVYERFMAFEDCDFLLDAPWLRATIFRYLFTRLADKQRVQACMDRLLAY